MLDDIGLGSAIANAIYAFLVAVAIIGFIVFFRKKIYVAAVVWLSIILNILSYLFFMGIYINYPSFMYLIVNKIWPLLNIALVIILIFNLIKNKKCQDKINF